MADVCPALAPPILVYRHEAPMMGRAPTFARSRRKPLAFIGDYFCDLLLYFMEALAYLLIKLLKPPLPRGDCHMGLRSVTPRLAR